MFFSKTLSLSRFYIQCLAAYFRPGVSWSLALLFKFLERLFYYWCNGWYFVFLTAAEETAFLGYSKLRAVEKNLYARYFFPSQFWIALTEGLKVEKPETLYRLTYGETSWFGIRKVLKELDATEEDVFYDLGCGTGRNVFFAHSEYGMQATGLDLIHTFVENANATVSELGLEKIAFREQDIFTSNLSDATLIYVTANCFDPPCIEKLIAVLKTLPSGARVVSTHRPLPCEHLKVTGSQRLFFSWGIDKVFYHQRV